MDINNYYDEVPVPSLDSATYAADMQDMVDKINENFRRLGSAVWLKGDRGASVERNDERLFDDDGNTTDLGREVFRQIYADYDIQGSNLDTYSSIRNFVSTHENGEENVGDVCSFDSIKLRQEYPDEFNDFISVLGIYEPGDNIEYTLIDGSFCGPWFFTDARIDKDVLDNMTDAQLQVFTDMSCALYGVYDEGWEVTPYNIMPTLYWNSDSNFFCWKINGRLTNVNAQGLEGDKGDNAQTYVLLGDEMDYENSEDVLMVRLTNVYDVESEDFVSINVYPDRDKLEGCLGAVWFKRQYAPEGPYIATFTLGIIMSGANDNYYIKYNTSNSHDINFDFAQIMALLGLKSQLMQITARPHEPQTEENNVLRGLFIPIEKRVVNSEDVESIIRTDRYHEMWSSLNETAISDSTAMGTDADLNIGVVEDINNPSFNTENPPEANINVYYKNFQTNNKQTRIVAGDVTTAQTEDDDIDIYAKDEVNVIADRMVDIDTPKVEMGNDDNKSYAVVHGKLTITGSEKDEDKIEVYNQHYPLSFAVIVRPLYIKFEKSDNVPEENAIYYTTTNFEFIFGYCGYSGSIEYCDPDDGGTESFQWMPVMYNAQRLESSYYAQDPLATKKQHTTIDGRDVEIKYGCTQIDDWCKHTIAPIYNQSIVLPKITITYKVGNDTYKTYFDYSQFIYTDNSSTFKTKKTIGLFNNLKQEYISVNTNKYQITPSYIQYGGLPLIQFFCTEERGGFLMKGPNDPIVSRIVEKVGTDYEIRDYNINGYSYYYDYEYGYGNFQAHPTTESNQDHIHVFEYYHTYKYPDTRILLSRRYDEQEVEVFQIFQPTGWVSALSAGNPEIIKQSNYTINVNIVPKGMVGYRTEDYTYNERFNDNKLYNGGMTCSLYNLHVSSNSKDTNTNDAVSEDIHISPNIRPNIGGVTITTPNEDDQSLLPDVETDNP